MTTPDELCGLRLEGTTLMLAGELTIYTAAALKDRILSALAELPAVDINLADVLEIDTAGLQLLLMAKQDAAHQQRSLQFTMPSPAVKELVDLYRLSDLLS